MNRTKKNRRIDIKQLRRRFSLTQEELTRESGVSLSTASRWETDRSRPSKLALLHIDHLTANGRRE